MKYLITFFLLTCMFFQGFSQRNPDLKVGLGMPFFLGNTSGDFDYNKVSGFPNVWLEKPIPIKINRDEKVSITPGVSFMYLKEKESVYGNETVAQTSNLNHYSLNGYTKLVYNLLLQRRSEAFLYFGGVVGVHITARTIGTKITYSNSISGGEVEENIKRSGRDFYNSIYFGPVLGFQPDMKITNKFVPSIELSFYPNFVTRLNNEKANAIQLTLLLGINQ